MKCLFIALLTVVAVSLSAARPGFHRPRFRAPNAARNACRVSWKQIAAGGAAAGTTIVAYKVSNGVEEGLKTLAKEQPEAFSGTLSTLTWPFRWGIWLLLAGGGYWLFRNFHRKEKEIQHGGSSEK